MENVNPVLLLLLVVTAANASMYHIGVGRADITGPAAEVVMVSILGLFQIHDTFCQIASL